MRATSASAALTSSASKDSLLAVPRSPVASPTASAGGGSNTSSPWSSARSAWAAAPARADSSKAASTSDASDAVAADGRRGWAARVYRAFFRWGRTPAGASATGAAPAGGGHLGVDKGAHASAGLLRLNSRVAHASAVAAAPPGVPRKTRAPPTHLYVLCHGLGGTPQDLSCLQRELSLDANALVHLSEAQANRQRFALSNTFDGVERGGARLAAEIRALARDHPQLTTISLVGNSLGGLYCRYAAALLFSANDGTLAGLVPDTYLTTASPHLGVGEHGALGVLPDFVLRGVSFLAAGGRVPTLQQLLLGDGDAGGRAPLLVRMTDETSPDGLPFLAALRSFRRRCTFTNAVNDSMVPWQTSALQPVTRGPMPWLFWQDSLLKQRLADANVLYEQTVPPYVMPPDDGRGSLRLRHMQRIAERLTTLQWHEVAVVFPTPFLAHNKICALDRGLVTRAMFKDGRAVVRQQQQFLLRRGKYEYDSNDARCLS